MVLYYVLIAAAVMIDILIALLIAGAAQRKDRSYASFFWLTFILGLMALVGVLIPALVVASLPFRQDDPRNPANRRTR
jgi:hypothetical protein